MVKTVPMQEAAMSGEWKRLDPVIEERRRLDRLIDAGVAWNEIERQLDGAMLDEEAEAVVWLRAYGARVDRGWGRGTEEQWHRHRVTSG